MIVIEPILLEPRAIKFYANHPVEYVKEVIGATPDENQGPILESCANSQLTSVRSGHGIGKLHRYETVIDTPTGKCCWGDIVPGDFVFGANGKPTMVLQCHHFKNVPMYRVTFDDGSFSDVSSGHLWNVRGRQERRNGLTTWRTLETIELLKLGVKRSNGVALARQWEIPIQGKAEFKGQKTDIHPYLMGLWLGDGSKGEPRYTKPYPEIVRRLQSIGYETNFIDETTVRIYNVAHLFKGGIFNLHSHERYIPDEYKYNTVNNRMALFQGLCDSDGEANQSGSIGYSTTSKRLAEDIIWLARSLGCKAQMQDAVKMGWYYNESGQKIKCRACYRVTINAPFNPFTLLHRKKSYKPSEERYIKRWIDSIEPLPNADGMCITVANADGLYLANDFIVTHNSAVESWVIKWFMYSRPFPKVPCTAPTQHQLHDILWAELNKWNRDAADAELFEWTDERFYHKAHREEWFAVPRTAVKADALQGFHADHVFYVLDEASGVKDEIFEPVLGALSTEGAKLLACGNPTQLAGWFFDSHNKNRDMYSVFHVDGRKSSRVSKQFVQMIIDMYGEDSDVFRVRVAGEFPKAMPDSLVPLDWVERNSEKELLIVAPQIIDIGIDVARYGDDESVICPVFDKAYQQKLEVYHHNDTMQLTGRTVQMIERYNEKYNCRKTSIKIDCDGLGVGVYDRLKEIVKQRRWKNVKVYECHFGGKGGRLKADDPVSYSNSTGLMWGTLREKLRHNGLVLCYDDKQIGQITNRKYRINSNGEIELEKKEDMKKRGLKSPDRADALVLAIWEPFKIFAMSSDKV